MRSEFKIYGEVYMEEIKAGCAMPAGTENSQSPEVKEEVFLSESMLKEEKEMIKVGKPAPQFSAQAFSNGKFVNVSLDEFKGKWVYLCFYPGDFTFV